ncbi:hypothetical protein ABPG74_016712 [Tetrahymena malaccensis]
MDIESNFTEYLFESSTESDNMSSSFQSLEKFYLQEVQNSSTYQYNQVLNNLSTHENHEPQTQTNYMNKNKKKNSYLQNEDIFSLQESESFSNKINIITNLHNLSNCHIPQIRDQEPALSLEKSKTHNLAVKRIKSNLTIAVDINKDENNNLQKNDSCKLLSPLSELFSIYAENCITNNEQSNKFNHFSCINSYKNPTSVQILNNLGTLEVFLNSKESFDANLTPVMQKLSKSDNQDINQFSETIQKYSVHLKNFQNKQDLLKFKQITNNFPKHLENKFNEFDIKYQQKLKQISKTNSFYSYSLFRFNVKKFEIEQTKIGYSEALLSVLGLDLQQAKQYILRKGIFEFTNQQNMKEQYFQYISKLLGEDVKNPFEVNLKTFDGFQAPAINNQYTLIDQDSQNPFLGYNQVLFINCYEIDESVVKNLISLRYKHKEEINESLKELEEDLYYSMEANIFLQKYYKNQAENYLMYSKRAKYRYIN